MDFIESLIDYEDEENLNDDPIDTNDNPPEPPVVIDDTDDDDSQGSPETDQSAVAYFEYLKANNILAVPDDFEFDGTSAKVEEALEITRNNIHNQTRQQFWEALPDDFKPLLEYGLMGGKSLKNYIDTFTPKQINEDISDPISQKLVISEYYKLMNPNMPDERIEKLLAKKEELGTLEEEAQDALEYIKEITEDRKAQFLAQQQQAIADEQARVEAENNKLKETINNSKEFDQLRKNRIETLFFTPKSQVSEFDQKLDSIYANYEHLVQLADILADYDPRVGFTFDRLKKKIKTESSRKMSDLINDKIDSKSKVTGTVGNITEDFDLETWQRNNR